MQDVAGSRGPLTATPSPSLRAEPQGALQAQEVPGPAQEPADPQGERAPFAEEAAAGGYR